MRVCSFLAIAAAGASLIPTVYAWGAAGHEIVATIAQIHLDPTVLPKICSILNWTSTNPNEPECHLAPIAAWADRVRWKYRWSSVLHYVEGVGDYPGAQCAFPGSSGWVNGNQNLLYAIRNSTAVLQEWDGTEQETGSKTNEALKFLVHWLGDMHQPLHMAARARGGNGIKVRFDGRQTSLHGLWDSLLISQRLRTIPSNYSLPLPFPDIEYNLRGTIYDSYIRRLMWEGLMSRWKDEAHSWLACPSIDNNRSQGEGVWQAVMNMFSGRDVAWDTDDDTLCPYAWAKPIEEMNCEFVWHKALDEPPYDEVHLHHSTSSLHDHSHSHSHPETLESEADSFEADPEAAKSDLLELDIPEYGGKIRREWIVEKLLMQGGIRLAGVLNWILADSEEVRQRGLWVSGL